MKKTLEKSKYTHAHRNAIRLDGEWMMGERKRYCRFGSRHSYRSVVEWFLICSSVLVRSDVCDTEERRYHALALEE